MKEHKKIEKKYIHERDKGVCYFCGKELPLKKVTLDHYLPKSKGGPDDTFNLVLCCKSCNKLKKSSIPEDYEQIMIQNLKKAVEDRKITSKRLGIKHEELIKIVYAVHRLEIAEDRIIFHGDEYSFYVEDNKISIADPRRYL